MKKILITIAIILVAITTLILIKSGANSATIEVREGTIEEEVLATGKTRSRQEVDLGFEVGGKVSVLNTQIGSKVNAGDILAVLDQSSLRASLTRAQASLKRNIETHTADIRDAYIKADDAVRNDIDQFFTNPRTYQARFNPTIEDKGLTYSGAISEKTKSEISSKRIEIEKLITEWEIFQSTMIEENNLSDAYRLAQKNLEIVQDFLGTVALAINSLDSVDFQYETTIQGYKNTVSEARGKINRALSVLIENAQIELLRADISSIEADLAKTVIRSPISGIVTKLEVDKGEIVSANDILISVISEKELQVEANVSEINIGKLMVGNMVTITLDAFPSENYSGEVVYIEPGETIIDKVPKYRILISFINPITEKIKSGLTANINIITAKRENVLLIPIYTIRKEGSDSFITLKNDDDNSEKRKIVTGLVGKDGSVEIVSGLSIGDKILVNKQ